MRKPKPPILEHWFFDRMFDTPIMRGVDEMGRARTLRCYWLDRGHVGTIQSIACITTDGHTNVRGPGVWKLGTPARY